MIRQYNVEDKVILTGAVDNPYPYIKRANLLVCTSKSESFSYVIAEAKVLHTPVVSNSFPVAYEVLDKSCGWIASLEEMPQLLFRLINDVDGDYSKVEESIKKYEYDNKSIMDKFYQLINA